MSLRSLLTFRSRFGPPRQLTLTRIGVFYVVLTLGMGLAGINTGNNLVMLTCGVMLGLIIASGVLSERSLRDLNVQRELPSQLAVGAPSLITLVLSNPKAFASFGVLVSEDDGKGRSPFGGVPLAAGASIEGAAVGRAQFPLVPAGGIERRAYRLIPSERGRLAFGKLRIATRFPFGLFEKSLLLDRPQEALVAPGLLPSALPLPVPREGAGEHGAPGEGRGPDPWELRPHREGEDVRRIAWAQSARAGQLLALTRERDGLAEARLVLRPKASGAARERHLAELRYQAEELLARGTAVALAAGPAGETTVVPAGLGSAQLSRLLRALASEPGADRSGARSDATAGGAPALGHLGVPRFLRWQRAMLFLVVLSAAAAVAASRELSWWLLAAFAAIAIYAFPTRERASAGFARAVNLSSLVTLAILAAAVFTKAQSLAESAAEATLLLCANRLLVRRDPSDDALLHLASFLTLAAGAALGGELEYGLCLAAFCALAAPSLTLAELRRGIEQDAPAQASALMAAPELTAPRLLGFAAALGGGALAFAVLLFPLFPRAQLGLLQALAFGGPRTTGVSERVDLTAGGALQDSSKLVLRAELTAGSAEALHYFRVITLETFTGTGWLPASRPTTQLRSLSTASAPTVSGILEPFVSAGDLIPIPEGLTDLRSDVPGVVLRIDDQGDLRLVSAPPAGLTFHFDAAEQRPPRAAPPAEDLALPQVSEAVRSFATSAIPEGAAPREAARDLQRALRGFSYTREPAGGATPLETFLRERRGDCQLFASAVAVMLRLRGVPARYVGGYYLQHPTAGENLVRAWDAHAWAEVLTPEGPLLVDATPPSERGGHQAHDGVWQLIVDAWQSTQFLWLRSVVDYDSRTQINQAQWLFQLGRRLWGTSRHPGALSLPRLLGLLLLALLIGVALRSRRWARDPAKAMEERLFRRLARAGLVRGRGTTYEEALAHLAPEVRMRASPLLDRIGAARFGGRPLAAGERAALARAIDRLSA